MNSRFALAAEERRDLLAFLNSLTDMIPSYSLTTTMRPTPRLPLLALALGAVLIATSPSVGDALVRRHTRLLRSVPAKDTVVTAAPATLELYFNERIQLAVSRVRLETAGGDSVVLGALLRDDSKPNTPVTAAVRGQLRPGRNVVRWSTASRDGHVVRDSFAFTLRAP